MSKLVPYLAIFAGLILCAIVVPGAIDTLDTALDFDSFSQTRAIVNRTSTQSHNRGPATGVVEYEFVAPNGEVVQGDNSLTRLTDSPEDIDRFVEREKGIERITVYFDPDDPSRSVIREISLWQPLGLIGLSLLLLFGGTHATIIDRRRRKLQSRALASRRR